MRSLQDNSTRWIQGTVLIFCDWSARFHIVAEGLAVLHVCKENSTVEQSFLTVGILSIARPLYAAAAGQLVIAQRGVTARPARGHFLPCIKELLGLSLRHQWVPLLIFKAHSLAVIKKYVNVRLCFAGRFNRFVAEMDRLIYIGKAACLLTPCGS